MVGSQDEDPEAPSLAEQLACEYVDAANRPLGNKLSAGVAAVLDDVDYILICGSDNIIGRRWVGRAVGSMESCPADSRPFMVGSRDLFVVDGDSGGVSYFPGYDPRVRLDPIGAGG